VSTIINAKNEELVRMRADKSTGKTSKWNCYSIHVFVVVVSFSEIKF
jgi:hypothetical protein